MAKHQWLTPHQKGIVRRYYEHKDDLMVQKLHEAVSDLYVCGDPKAAERLWKKVQTALVNAGLHEERARRIADSRDLDRLARVVGELF